MGRANYGGALKETGDVQRRVLERDSPLSMPEEAPGPAAQINIPTTARQKSYAVGDGPMHIPPLRITKHPTLILCRAEISLHVAHLPGLCTYTHASELRSTLLERVGCPVTQKTPRDARMWLEGVYRWPLPHGVYPQQKFERAGLLSIGHGKSLDGRSTEIVLRLAEVFG